MPYKLKKLTSADGSPAIEESQLRRAIDKLVNVDRPRYRRLWGYYRNPMRAALSAENGAERPYRQAQEWGLPPRITGVHSGRELFEGTSAGEIARKEVVIENDIGWRVETLVDYLFGKPLVIESTAPDADRRALLGRIARAIIAHNGGVLFLQQLALMGAVHGFVDVLVKVQPERAGDVPAGHAGARELGERPADAEAGVNHDSPRPSAGSPSPDELGVLAAEGAEGGPAAPADDQPAGSGPGEDSLEQSIQRMARMIRLEIVEPARAVAFLSPQDYRQVDAYGQVYEMPIPAEAQRRREVERRWWQRLIRSGGLDRPAAGEGQMMVSDLISPTSWQRYHDELLVAEGDNALGRIPLVHIQNTAVPFEYSGASDVEPLIPLQDELNTRLSDRANRITLQSFRMYLGKGIDNFTDLPISPGRMWMTDNEKAEVIEFGGDDACPSESLHIADIREALDKSSGVSPIAAGAIKNRIGRLTSAAALRVTLISLLAKTEKKRTTYGTGLGQMIELALAWLDRLNIFPNDPQERGVEIHWPNPMPENRLESLQEAEIKTRLGVGKQVVLRELGY